MQVLVSNTIRFRTDRISPATIKAIKGLFEFSVWVYNGSPRKLEQAIRMLKEGKSEREVTNTLKMSSKQVWWLSSQLKKGLDIKSSAGRQKLIVGWEINGGVMTVPRGMFQELRDLTEQVGLVFEVDDKTLVLPSVDFEFHGKLRQDQEEAVAKAMSQDCGIIEAPTGAGKTVMAMAAIAYRKQPTTIVVHTDVLLRQWRERIEQFLRLTPGMLGGGQKTLGKVNVAMVQTLARNPALLRDRTGFLIVDEVHRAPAEATFWNVVRSFPARYILGLSATPYRSDQMDPLIRWCVGPILAKISRKALQENGHVMKPEIIIRETEFQTELGADDFASILSEIPRCKPRNRQILADVLAEHGSGEVCLVLTDRVEHALNFVKALRMNGVPAEVLTGSKGKKERQSVIEQLASGSLRCVVATAQLVGEGFDCKELSCMFLTMPIKFRGRLIQYIGRVLRPAPGKTTAKVYDYVDSNVPVLLNQAKARMREYHKI